MNDQRELARRSVLAGLAALPACSALPLRSANASTPSATRDLTRLVSGSIVSTGEAGFEQKRADVWTTYLPTRRPRTIVTARTIQDVQNSVRYAAKTGMRVAIRGGGHNWTVSSLRDDSLLIDLGQLRGFRLNKGKAQAWVQPGVSGGAFFQAIRQEGFAFPVAHCPSVPMSGFLLNGGFGWNSNAWGSAAANILSIDVVVADGSLVRASRTENVDLFWAACGSGTGFFGIAVGFELALMPLPGAIVATNYIFPLAVAADASRWADTLRASAGVDVEYSYLVSASGGDPSAPGLCVVSGIAFGENNAKATAELAYLRDSPLASRALMVEREVETSWETLFESVAALFPPKLNYLGQTIWTESQISSFYPAFANMLAAPSSPFNFSNCVFYPLGRENSPTRPDLAASMQRSVLCLYYAIWDDQARNAENESWFRSANAVFQAHATGHYIGETDLNQFPQYAQHCYGNEQWLRLKELRKKWDPEGRFFDFVGQPG
jgi:FAD/FMN-containing dehydrogenase